MRALCRTRTHAVWLLLILAGLALAGCGGGPEVYLPATPTEDRGPTATPAPPTATPAPAELIVCLAEEPESLYLYGDISPSADAILEAIYDGPIDLRGFQARPVLLEKIPSLADGDAVIEPVSIASGDVYLNPVSFQAEALAYGMPYLPSGCRQQDCIETYNGGQVDVDRMTVQFHLLPDLTWSDGEPLTAQDSVFSYRVDGDTDTPTAKYLYARTYSYRALDERTLEWVGVPGFLDADFATNIWSPLPQHALSELPVGELASASASAEAPLGWGPYVVDQWDRGSQLVLKRNPNYRLVGQGLPGFDTLVFRFLNGTGSALDQLRSGECDVIDEGLLPSDELPTARTAVKGQSLTLAIEPGAVVERLDFNLQPMEGADHAGMLSDHSTRRALASCVDRVGLAQSLFGDQAVVPSTFLPPDHPLYDPGQEAVAYDPESGQMALDEIGWRRESNGAPVRTAAGVTGVPDGTPLALSLRSLPGGMGFAAAEWVKADLEACGVQVDLEPQAAAELFATWPDGPVFGRRFDMVTWAWPAFASPPCEMFAGWEIPSEEQPNGINASGYQVDEYDTGCDTLLLSPPGTAAYDDAIVRVQASFVDGLPALPLFVRPRSLAYANWICGVELDPTTVTELWNLERFIPCP
ncbi:MAG: ABC transporter substrate-binding protein [Anaerolineales bacterium]